MCVWDYSSNYYSITVEWSLPLPLHPITQIIYSSINSEVDKVLLKKKLRLSKKTTGKLFGVAILHAYVSYRKLNILAVV